MSRLAPTDWRTLVRVFEADGFTRAWHHRLVVLGKPGIARPVVIPKYVGVGLGIIGNNMRTDGMSRGRSFELLGEL